MIRTYLKIVFFLFFSFIINAQNIDSLLEVYPYANNQLDKYEIDIQLARAYFNNQQLDSAQIFAEKALQISQSFETNIFLNKTYQLLADIHLAAQNFNQSDSFYTKAIEITTDKSDLIVLYDKKFTIQIRKGNVDKGLIYLNKTKELIGKDSLSIEAIEYYLNTALYYAEKHEMLNNLKYLLKAKELAKRHNYELLNINYSLSIVFESIKAYDQALQIYTENRINAQNNKKPNLEMYALFGISSASFELKNYTQSKKACFETILLKEKHHLSYASGYVYFILGMNHLAENHLDSAQYYFEKGVEISKFQNENKELGDNLIGLSKLMLKKGDLQLAKSYAEQAKTTITYTDVETNSILARIYENDKNYKKAYEVIRENWDDWEKKEENRTEYKIISTLLNDKFQQEKIQEELIFQQKFSRQRRLLFLTIFTLALLIISIIAFIQIRNNQKLKALNKALNQRNEALKHFTYITSHDLKEPIRNIKSFSGLLKRKLSNREHNQDEQDYLNFINNSSETLYEIVESLKTFTEVSFGDIHREEVIVSSVFNTVENNVKELLGKTNKTINFDNPDNITTISFSKNMLILILQNLVQNGLKYNSSIHPIINVSISKKNNQILFKVSDNGIGVKPEYFDKIFQPFKTLENKSITKSSGLGLAICKNIIENYGGKIWITSAEETGSQFYFTI